MRQHGSSVHRTRNTGFCTAASRGDTAERLPAVQCNLPLFAIDSIKRAAAGSRFDEADSLGYKRMRSDSITTMLRRYGLSAFLEQRKEREQKAQQNTRLE